MNLTAKLPRSLSGAMKTYYKRLAAGVCPRCGGPRNNGWLHCDKCLARVKSTRKYKPHTEKEKAYNRLWYWRRRNLGLCVLCGNQVEDTKHAYCEICRQRKKEYEILRARARVLLIPKMF